MSNQSGKNTLRAAYKKARTAFVSADAGAASGTGICVRVDREIMRQLTRSAVYQSAKTIFTYVSVGAETDTRALTRQAFADGKTVCVPRTSGKGDAGHMDAVPLTLDQYLAMIEAACRASGIPGTARTRNQIPEPPDDCPALAPEQLDLILVPSLAVDVWGYRLGYGGGYYDRYIEAARKAKKGGGADTVPERPVIIAIQRSAFVVETALPREPHDQRADAILTENGFTFPSFSDERDF
jgi:5-formyltetrahydrofolate cyclo-ligase